MQLSIQTTESLQNKVGRKNTKQHSRCGGKEPEENEGTSSKGNGTISVPYDGTIGERRKKG